MPTVQVWLTDEEYAAVVKASPKDTTPISVVIKRLAMKSLSLRREGGK